MTVLSGNPWITGGMLAASFLLGTLSGAFFFFWGLGLSLKGEKRPPKAPFRKTLFPALFSGAFFALVLFLRGGLGAGCFRDWGFLMVLLTVSVTDLRRFEIPDGPLIAGIILWILWMIAGGIRKEADPLAALITGGLAAILFSGTLLALSLLMDRLTGKETLGGGDIKLVFVVMLHLGFLRGFLCLVISLASGLIFILARKDRRIPWAPSIAIGALAALLLGAFLAASDFFPFFG